MIIHLKKRILLVYICAIVLAITALYEAFFSSNGKNIIISETTLLNPRYSNLISTITLTSNSTQSIVINKTNSGYTGKIGNTTFPVNSIKIHELISLFSSRVTSRLISNKSSDWVHYGVDDLHSSTLIFSGFDSENNFSEFSKLHFGYTDFTGSNRYIRSSKNIQVYEMPDEYFSFLSASPSAWVDPKFISHYVRGINSENTVESITITNDESKRILLRGDENFEDAVKTLFTLQSSNVVPIDNFNFLDNLLYTINVQFFDKTEASFMVLYNTEYIIAPIHTDLFYGLEISAWTFENLLKSLID